MGAAEGDADGVGVGDAVGDVVGDGVGAGDTPAAPHPKPTAHAAQWDPPRL